MSKEKIALYLMSKKGLSVLEYLVQEKYHYFIGKVIIGRDKNVVSDYSEELKTLCIKHDILCYERTDDFSIDEKYSMAISWRWMIEKTKSRLIVLHDSLLPKYRGFSPLVNALLNKEKEIGVTAIFASDDYDSGEIIDQAKVSISYPIKINQAIDLVIKNYIALVTTIFKSLQEEESISSISQKEDLATYSLWRDEDDYFIDWKWNVDEIVTFVNAVGYPYKGATSLINREKVVRVLEVERYCKQMKIVSKDNEGKVLFLHEGYPVVVCKDGCIKIKSLVNEQGESVLPLKKMRTRFSKPN